MYTKVTWDSIHSFIHPPIIIQKNIIHPTRLVDIKKSGSLDICSHLLAGVTRPPRSPCPQVMSRGPWDLCPLYHSMNLTCSFLGVLLHPRPAHGQYVAVTWWSMLDHCLSGWPSIHKPFTLRALYLTVSELSDRVCHVCGYVTLRELFQC